MELKPNSGDEKPLDEDEADYAMFEGDEDIVSQLLLEGDTYAFECR